MLRDALRSAPNRLRGVAVLDADDGDDVLAELDAAGVRACRAQGNLLRGDHLVADRHGAVG